MTYEEIQDEVLRNLIDTPTAVQEGVPDYVNRAMRTLQGKWNFKVMEAESDYTTTEGSHVLSATMPTRFKEFRLEPFCLRDDGSWWELSIAPNQTAIRRWWGEEDEGYPSVLVEADPSDDEDAHALHVYPLPDGNSDYGDGEYRISVPYLAYVADLSGSSDSNWFTNNATEWLIFQATAEGFFTDWDESRAAIWTQRAANKFDEVKMLDKRRRLGGVRELVPQWRGAKQPFVRR